MKLQEALNELSWIADIRCPWVRTVRGQIIGPHDINYDERIERSPFSPKKKAKLVTSLHHKIGCPKCGNPVIINLSSNKAVKGRDYKDIFIPNNHPYYRLLKNMKGVTMEDEEGNMSLSELIGVAGLTVGDYDIPRKKRRALEKILGSRFKELNISHVKRLAEKNPQMRRRLLGLLPFSI